MILKKTFFFSLISPNRQRKPTVMTRTKSEIPSFRRQISRYILLALTLVSYWWAGLRYPLRVLSPLGWTIWWKNIHKNSKLWIYGKPMKTPPGKKLFTHPRQISDQSDLPNFLSKKTYTTVLQNNQSIRMDYFNFDVQYLGK